MKPSEYIGRAIDLFYIAPLRRWIPHEMFRYGACGAFNPRLLRGFLKVEEELSRLYDGPKGG